MTTAASKPCRETEGLICDFDLATGRCRQCGTRIADLMGGSVVERELIHMGFHPGVEEKTSRIEAIARDVWGEQPGAYLIGVGVGMCIAEGMTDEQILGVTAIGIRNVRSFLASLGLDASAPAPAPSEVEPEPETQRNPGATGETTRGGMTLERLDESTLLWTPKAPPKGDLS